MNKLITALAALAALAGKARDLSSCCDRRSRASVKLRFIADRRKATSYAVVPAKYAVLRHR